MGGYYNLFHGTELTGRGARVGTQAIRLWERSLLVHPPCQGPEAAMHSSVHLWLWGTHVWAWGMLR